MKLIVNGTVVDISNNLTLEELLNNQGITIETKGVAVAINEEVVTRSKWSTEMICEGDRIEVIRATQGG